LAVGVMSRKNKTSPTTLHCGGAAQFLLIYS
jgi:hypothetical protein